MKTGTIAVRSDRSGELFFDWSSPVAEMSYAFMGWQERVLKYVPLPRRVGVSYMRVVNPAWRWWRVYYAWDWLMRLLKVRAR